MNRDYEDLGGRDPWSVLGLRPGADPAEIKRAYRRKAQTEHSDVGGDDDRQTRLNLARDVLLDAVRRHDYEERMRREAQAPTDRPAPAEPAEPPDEPADRFQWVSGAGPSTGRIRWGDPPPPPRQQPAAADQPLYPNYQSHPRYESSPRYESPQYRMYPQPPPYRSHPGAARPWNGLAIASLVVSLLCWPVGLPMALVALSQVRRTGERGAVMAWIAIGFAGLTVVLVCVQFLTIR